ncbi:hypothetical protein A9G31_09670 [Gilliamella sp. Gris1-4]|nr:hypothetical protein A9G31_09670 [Gilliamella apicola]
MFRLKFISKFLISLLLTPFLLLSYPLKLQALTTYTTNIIHGSAPYLTFDNGQTKATTTDMLLAITLPDGTRVMPSTNISSSTNPIKIINGSSFSSVGMLIPPSTNSIGLDDLIRDPYNYWGDDDGDGQGTNGVSASGTLSVVFTDKNNHSINRNDVLDICNAPYKITLSTTDGHLTTRYGVPSSTTFNGASATYFISPDSSTSCYFVGYARPNLKHGENNVKIEGNNYNFAGPSEIWNSAKGFLVQSNNPSSYGLNFPTTGADGLYFDLDIEGVDVSQLTWSPITLGGITATVTRTMPNANPSYDGWISDKSQYVTRVTLTGPRASDSQIKARNPSPLGLPTLPQTFELVGRNSSGNVVVKYGFELKQWFVNRGDKTSGTGSHRTWCDSLGWRLVEVSDLTNAVRKSSPSISGATPSSDGNNYQRRIGAGFFTEWGYMNDYANADFRFDYYVTDTTRGSGQFNVGAGRGYVHSVSPGGSARGGLCVTP